MGRRAQNDQRENVQTASTKPGVARKPHAGATNGDSAGKTLFSASVLALTGCGSERPPAELAGLWSAGPAACEAGMGLRFEDEAIAAVYDGQREVMFQNPRYRVEEHGEEFRVRVSLRLAAPTWRRAKASAHMACWCWRATRRAALRPSSHNLIDARTGSARMRIVGDPTLSFALQPCGDHHPWRENLRGRSGA